MSIVRTLLLTLIVLVMAACGGGGSDEDDDNGGRVIFGRVIDAGTSQGIRNASILTSPQTASVLTDSAGQFRITDNVELGNTYVVTASATGYETVTLTVAVGENSGSAADFLLRPRTLSVDDNLLQFSDTRFDAQIRLSATHDTDYRIESSHSWLTVSPSSGELRADGVAFLNIQADSSQAPADRITDAWLQITSEDRLGPAAVNVVVTPQALLSDDSDADGVADVDDNCPYVANAAQSDSDSDGAGDLCDALLVDDPDLDGVGAIDNCPAVPNASQLDSDADGIGDACDSQDNAADGQNNGNGSGNDDGSDGNGGTVTPDNGVSDISISAFAATPNRVMIDELVRFSWQFAAGENDVVTCLIDVDGNGTNELTVDNCTNSQTATYYYLTPGTYEPVLTVQDSNGGTETIATLVTVLPLQVNLAMSETAAAGESLRYEFTIGNVSLVPVNDVRVLFRVPTGLAFSNRDDAIPDLTGCFSCDEGDEAVWRLGTLAAGMTRSILLNARVLDSVVAGSFINSKIDVTATDVTGVISREQPVEVQSGALISLSSNTKEDLLSAGDSVAYRVTVGNVSSGNVSNVELRTQLPRNATASNISDDGVFDNSTGEVVWSFGSLPVLQSHEFNMSVALANDRVPGQIQTIRSSLSHDGGATLDAARTEVVKVVSSRQPLELSVTTLSNPVEAGGRLQYQLTLNNTGLVPLSNAFVAMVVPQGITFSNRDDALPDLSGCFSCAEGSEGVWSFDTVPAGASVGIIVNANVSDSLQAGTLIDAVFHAGADGLPGWITKTAVATIDNSPTSQLAISASREPVSAGEELVLTLDVGNISSATLENVGIDLGIPEGVSVSAISDSGAESGNDGSISWPTVSVPVLDSVQRTVTLAVDSDVISGQIFEFRSTVRNSGGPLLDRIAEQVVTISNSTQPLNVAILPSVSNVIAGQNIRYAFQITNVGLVPVNNVFAVYRLPEGLSFSNRDDAEPDARGCFSCTAGSEAFWTFDSIAAGETVNIEVNAQVSTQLQAGSLVNAIVTVGGDGVNDTTHLSKVVAVRQ